MDPGTLALHADALEDSSFRVRLATLLTLHELEPATIAQHAHAIVARLEDAPFETREMALKTLGKLDPAALAQHADAVAARLEDSNWWVRSEALRTLGELNPTALAQHADAVAARYFISPPTHPFLPYVAPHFFQISPFILVFLSLVEDSHVTVRHNALMTLGKLEPVTLAQPALVAAIAHRLDDRYRGVAEAALSIAKALPKALTSNLDLVSAGGRSQLIGRAAWYRCRLRLRWRRVALYWYALPYRPSGPGHARDVEAWERMSKRSRHVGE